MRELLNKIPVIAMRDICILPGMRADLDIRRERSVKAYRWASEGKTSLIDKGILFLVLQKDPKVDEPSSEDLMRTGVVAKILPETREKDGTIHLCVEGLSAATFGQEVDYTDLLENPEHEVTDEDWLGISFDPESECLMGNVMTKDEMIVSGLEPWEEEAMTKALRELFSVFCQESRSVSREQVKEFFGEDSLAVTVRRLCKVIPMPARERQKLLDADTFQELFNVLTLMLRREIEVFRIKNDLASKVKKEIDKDQRTYFLREEMKVIRKELGEDNTESDTDQYLKKTEELDADESVKARLRKEIARLKTLGGSSAEASVARTYIETLLEMPWNRKSEDNMDLVNAARVLDEDHYGLEKVKERVLEYLAVRVLNKSGDTPILCLVGPSGTGKTSIARSVARALNKKYVRISLGGVKDEAEIRGHRRTYIGALPGRIAESVKMSGVANPLMLLDEIDKSGSDYKGDTASALLEVLDPEQNIHFSDHYIELPIDLSQVLFITTANDMNKIPQPLADRMEIIEVTSYTENEKFHIAKEHLVEKQLEHNGLKKEQLRISPKALELIISGYTREAGVRSLERMIGRICRKAARMIVEGEADKVSVKEANLEEFLGKPKFRKDETDHTDLTGIAHGLAWTSAGGVTLEIEVNVMPGKGVLTLTGQMGDVMKESAQAGISFIRSKSEELGIPADYFDKHDIHVHIPAGAVPKDGPSAGITMATAITSAVTGRKVRGDLAMTGEITLRGRVLPIGGLKEKLLAAGKAGFTTVLVPGTNRADVSEIDEEITGPLDIIFVSDMEEVLERALR